MSYTKLLQYNITVYSLLCINFFTSTVLFTSFTSKHTEVIYALFLYSSCTYDFTERWKSTSNINQIYHVIQFVWERTYSKALFFRAILVVQGLVHALLVRQELLLTCLQTYLTSLHIRIWGLHCFWGEAVKELLGNLVARTSRGREVAGKSLHILLCSGRLGCRRRRGREPHDAWWIEWEMYLLL